MADDPNSYRMPRNRLVLLLILAAAIAAAGWFWLAREQSQPESPQQSVKAPTKAKALLAELDREAAKLIGKTRHYGPSTEKALEVRAAIKSGDFAAAGQGLRANMRQSKVGNWGFRPFAIFIRDVPQARDEEFLKRLGQWIARDTGSAFPYLLRALYYRDTAWMRRGGRFAADVQADNLKFFRERMKLAKADAEVAICLDGNNPYGYFLQLSVLGSRGNTPEMGVAFEEAIRKFPSYYALYEERLSSLVPKRGGSTAKMLAFVDTYAGAADASSPLKMLYVELYRDFLDNAGISCRRKQGDARRACVAEIMRRQVSDALETKVYDALQLCHQLDPYSFTMKLGPILMDMIKTKGGERFAGALLQLSADAMGSDNQLAAPDTSGNNFMMDRLTGLVWYRRGHMENAETMYKRAIADLEHTNFPSEEARDQALAELYDALAGVYARRSQHKKVVIYEKAADALAGPIRPHYGHLLCASLYELKLFDAAVAACTTQIEQAGNMQSAYWRGRVYEETGQIEEVLADFRRVAGSEDSFRNSAAIEMSVIHARRKNLPRMLATLNAYAFLYEEDNSSKKNIAIAYNNRCYAKMHLGLLREALQDCTASLSFDSLPDAFQKQQELIKRLKAHQTGT